MNKSKGDKVIVKANMYGHCFEIGQELTIIRVRQYREDYAVTDGKIEQYLTEEELE